MEESKMKEMEIQLKRFKGERIHLRRIFSTSFNKMNDVLKDKNIAEENIEIEYKKFIDKQFRLNNIEQQVSELLFYCVNDEEELAKEIDTVESYRDKGVEITTLYEQRKRVISDDSTHSSSVSNNSKNRTYKLPKLQLYKFNGELKNWIGFWAQYRKIHEDKTLDKEDKFQYLIQSTLEGTPAYELVASFPPSATNYDKAIEQLKIRFGRDELLIELYVRELLKLVLDQITNEKRMSLRYLYDRLETQLRALESLGVTSEKYACMIFPLVESALPEAILREWERRKSAKRLDEAEVKDSILEELLVFLRQEVESEERVQLARSSFKKNESIEKAKRRMDDKSIATASSLINAKTENKKICIFCDERHNCFKAQNLDLEEVKRVVKTNGCCYNCLNRGHTAKMCKANLRCIICNRKHQPIMCPERKGGNTSQKVSAEVTTVPQQASLANCEQKQVFMQSFCVHVQHESLQCAARALIDTGSQRSYISKRLVSLMKYTSRGKEKISHALFGGAQTEAKTHLKYNIQMKNPNTDYIYQIEVLDTPELCSAIPVAANGSWKTELEDNDIILYDMKDAPIDILIGVDFAGQLLTGRKKVLSCGLVAIETYLGWTLIGKTNESIKSDNSVTLFVQELALNELWDLEILGIEDPVQKRSSEERQQEAKSYFLETVKTLSDGRYEVHFPWINEHPPLDRNFELAKARLNKTLAKLNNILLFEEYDRIFQDWLEEGIIEEVPFNNWNEGHYLPHRPVLKDYSTTKIRPVFDASAHGEGHPSLNNCLEKGENLITLIPNLLLRMRMGKIGVIADIKKAFLQISVTEEDRDFLRFLWIDKNNGLRILRHKRIVFGVTTSPFLLSAVIQFHLNKIKKLLESKELTYSEKTISQLEESFYVDNCVASLENDEELFKFINEATEIFSLAQFELRGWEYSNPSLQFSTETPLLGLRWDRKNDTLKVKSPKIHDCKKINRRNLLSMTQQIFDVLGVCSPSTIVPKLLIQQTWNSENGWDDEVEIDTRHQAVKWLNEVKLLEEIEIPRYIEFKEDAQYSLHTFCDASQLAYATVCFLRVDYGEQINVHFIGAKSRVAPKKKTTIPRLELLAATIGARLGYNILQELGDIECTFWSDSTTVISWIRREEPWSIFVWNRVHEIRRLTNKEAWSHVPGHLNPADLGSRGCSPKYLVESKWWEGPPWLKLPKEEWPLENVKIKEDEILQERRKLISANLVIENNNLLQRILKFYYNYSKLKRTVGWMLRFVNNFFKLPGNCVSDTLSVQELESAEKFILRLVQEESFNGVNDQQLKNLKPLLDSENLLRVRTKIWLRKDSEDFRAPIILPSKHEVVERIIFYYHQRFGHQTGQGLMNVLREKYWILRCRQTVRRVVGLCLKCKRYSTRSVGVETPPLPEERVRDAKIFEIIGIDFAGPLHLKNREKVWVCVFTCAVYRAIHLELVDSMSTETFIMALRRFIARRGRPSIIYSDNGTNLKGAYNLLKKVNWNRISDYSADLKITWKFNPPTAAWWGGFWERLIGMLKKLLRRILGKASLHHEELHTILCDCESYLNDRPITYMSEDNHDPIPITPNMFLQEIKEEGIPDLDRINEFSFGKRAKYRQRIKEEIRQRFRLEYLSQLLMPNEKTKEEKKINIGDLVLIGSDDRKKHNWPLAVVERLVEGRDGKQRVAYLKTADGLLCRPIQRIFPLELKPVNPGEESKIEDTSGDQPAAFSEKMLRPKLNTRRGREVKIPARYLD